MNPALLVAHRVPVVDPLYTFSTFQRGTTTCGIVPQAAALHDVPRPPPSSPTSSVELAAPPASNAVAPTYSAGSIAETAVEDATMLEASAAPPATSSCEAGLAAEKAGGSTPMEVDSIKSTPGVVTPRLGAGLQRSVSTEMADSHRTLLLLL